MIGAGVSGVRSLAHQNSTNFEPLLSSPFPSRAHMTDRQINTMLGCLIGAISKMVPPNQVRKLVSGIAEDDGFWSLLEDQLLPMSDVLYSQGSLSPKIDPDQ